MNRKTMLKTALKIVTGDRQATHGKPERTFELIARLWSAYLGIPLDAADVSVLMILLKVARLRSKKKYMDNWVDIAGYAACGAELASEEPMSEVSPVAEPLDEDPYDIEGVPA